MQLISQGSGFIITDNNGGLLSSGSTEQEAKDNLINEVNSLVLTPVATHATMQDTITGQWATCGKSGVTFGPDAVNNDPIYALIDNMQSMFPAGTYSVTVYYSDNSSQSTTVATTTVTI